MTFHCYRNVSYLFISFLVTLSNSFITGQPGELISSFGVDGRMTFDIENRIDRMLDVTVLTNDDIIAVGFTKKENRQQFVVAKFEQDGQFDEQFGQDGILHGDLSADQSSEAIMVTPGRSGGFYVLLNYFGDNNRIRLVKFMASGSIDSTFATNGLYILEDSTRRWTANAILVTAKEEILLTAESGALILVLKLTSTGLIDQNFGTEGHLILDQGNKFQRTLALAEQEDGKVVMTGEANVRDNIWKAFVMRITADGIIDSTFNKGGYYEENLDSTLTSTGQSIYVTKENKLLVVGGLHNGNVYDALLIRLQSSGEPDMTFGDQGGIIIPTSGNNVIREIRSFGNDEVILAGDRVMIKLTDDFALDNSFWNQGIKTHINEFIYGISINSNQELIVAGSTLQDFFLAKYRLASTTSTTDLNQNNIHLELFPNPLKRDVTVICTLSSPTWIRIDLWEVNGRILKTLLHKNDPVSGRQRFELQMPPNIPAGSYIITVSGNKGHTMKQVVIF